jgi:hypothetical protein
MFWRVKNNPNDCERFERLQSMTATQREGDENELAFSADRFDNS